MVYLIFSAILLVPLIEIALFILVGGLIGLWPTLALAVITAFVGTYLIRRQGLGIIVRVQSELASNRMPVAELFGGMCLLVAGALLLTPGFATDALGGVLLVPFFRHVLLGFVARHVSVVRPGPQTGSSRTDDTIIDAEYEDMTENNPPKPAPPTIEHR